MSQKRKTFKLNRINTCFPGQLVPKHTFLCLVVLFVQQTSVFGNGPATDSISNTRGYNYADKGFRFEDPSGNYQLNIEFRGQFRWAYPFHKDPIEQEDFSRKEMHLGINRARMKVGGHSFKPWVKYYLEYELQASNLLDFRLMLEKHPRLKLKVGQWKVQYNRERIISSGKQQTLERSILTRAFTIDRQQGLSVYGNLAGKGALNFNYWLSAFAGNGRGSSVNDDEHLMYMGRLQWNPNGKALSFSGSDLSGHSSWRSLLAVAAVTNRSPYTRFSQDGGGQLEGFTEGLPGQYRVNQLMQESAGMYKGFSWQQEWHFKQINDKVNQTRTNMSGYLVQAGYLMNNAWNQLQEEVEVYIRRASYYPDRSDLFQKRNEWTWGLNWFFNGHRSKLTGEASWLDSSFSANQQETGWRFRLQWDVSL